MKIHVLFMLIILSALPLLSQAQLRDTDKDSIFIEQVQELSEPHKILHAEPLFIDLIRDLGARKGEKEWNIGFGLTDNNTYDKYTALVEYEWAPVDRLGLEVELPFSVYYPVNGHDGAPGSKLNSLKLAAQYTFLVSARHNTSLAAGYIHEFELPAFVDYNRSSIITGHVYNPFFVAAKRWTNQWHSLVYTGPFITHHTGDNSWFTSWQANSNIHFMISGTRNFVGIEFNKQITGDDFDMTIRPQMRLGIKDNLLVGIVAGIPVSRENERFSTFMRLIYEPGHKKH